MLLFHLLDFASTYFLHPSHTDLLMNSSPSHASYGVLCVTGHSLFSPSLPLFLLFLFSLYLSLLPPTCSCFYLFSDSLFLPYYLFLLLLLPKHLSASFLSLSLYCLGCAITSHLYTKQTPTYSLRSSYPLLIQSMSGVASPNRLRASFISLCCLFLHLSCPFHHCSVT